MESIIELYVNGPSTGTTIGKIDLYGDEPISLNYSITDIKDISKRNSTYSQNFTVPASKNNNILFNHIFNIGSDSSYDPSKKYPAFILVDNIQVVTGNIQLTKIKVKDKNVISYDLIIYGETIDLVKALGDSYLEDLDFSELNHAFNVDSIQHSWTANTANLGYYYPLIDYGYDLSIADLNTAVPPGYNYNGVWYPNGGCDPVIFKPALSNKYLLDKIFNTRGFSYTSAFLNSEDFTETIIPYNGSGDNVTLPTIDADNLLFKASLKMVAPNYPSSAITYGAISNTPVINLSFNNDSTGGNFDDGGNYNNATSIYTNGTATTIQKFFVDLKFRLIENTAGNPIIVVRWHRNGGIYPFHEDHQSAGAGGGVSPTTTTLTFSTPVLNQPNSNNYYPLQPGETIRCTYQVYGLNNAGWFNQMNVYSDATSFYNAVYTGFIYDDVIDYNAYIPKKIKQIDYLKSIITMFNLMVVPSKDNTKNLIIEPRPVYLSQGVIKDWTDKLDVNQPIEETLISEQQSKQILLTYKEDKDYYNTLYKEKNNTTYGQHIQPIDNEWLDAKSKQSIEVIFSPTPSDHIDGTQEIIVPMIGKLETSGAFGKTDSNIRFLRKRPQLLETSSASTATLTMLGGTAQHAYPFCGHLSDPFSQNVGSETVDYNFGAIAEAFYETPGYSNLQNITPNNLVELYWKDYLDDISDKNSKLIKCKIKLSAADIAEFNFNDSIYLEGLTDDGGSYFLVNKITYNPTSFAPSTVELIKINRQLSPKFLPKNLGANKSPLKRNAIVLGKSSSDSKNTFAMGENVFIDKNSEGSVAFGNYIHIGNSSNNSYANGNNIFIDDNVQSSILIGNNIAIVNDIPTGLTTSAMTAFASISGVTIFASNYTATTSDTVYVPNIQFTTTGGTINGVTIQSITAATIGGNLWSSSTGGYSIIANNTTGNLASGPYFSTVLGGNRSSATTAYATVVNGMWNNASGGKSLVGNGQLNIASGYYSLVGNGSNNRATAPASIIVGGNNNRASGQNSFIANGNSNSATTNGSIVIGGDYNVSSGYYSVVGGGVRNNSYSDYSTIVNGYKNLALADKSFIGNGNSNSGTALYSIVVNGYQNKASGNYSSVIGGRGHTASGAASLIGNGLVNIANQANATVINGNGHLASGNYGTIINGAINTASGDFSLVGNGKTSIASGNYSSVFNGKDSVALGYNSFVAGVSNSGITLSSSVFGGKQNYSSGIYSSVFGGQSNTASSSFAAVLGGQYNNSLGASALVVGGLFNTAASLASTVIGGSNNIASGSSSFIFGGSGNIAAGDNSAMIACQNFTGTSANTVYMPAIAFEASGSSRAYREIPIGDWNMLTTGTNNVSHSLSVTEWKTVRSMSTTIINDTDTAYYELTSDGSIDVTSAGFQLGRVAAGIFQTAGFSTTPFNRGFVNFWYTPD